MTDFYDALETRDPAAREAAHLAALPGHVAAAQRTRAFGEILAGVDASQHHQPRRPGRAAGHAQGGTARTPARHGGQRPLRRLFGHRLACTGPGTACRAGVPVARPHLRTRQRQRRLLAHRARHARGRPSRRRPGAQQLQLPPDARRLDHGKRRACAGLHRVPGRRGQHRDAVAGRGRTAPRCLRRHAQFPAHPGGQGGRNRRGPAVAEKGPGQWRSLSAVLARLAGRTRHHRLPGLCHGRMRLDRLRNRSPPGPAGGRRRAG